MTFNYIRGLSIINQTIMFKNFKLFILLSVLILSFFNGFSHTGKHSKDSKVWLIQNSTKTINARYISLNEQRVYLIDNKTQRVVNFPITDFSMEDQFLFLKQHELSERINQKQTSKIHLEISDFKKINKTKAGIFLFIFLLLITSLILSFRVSKVRKPASIRLFCSLFVLIVIACSPEEEINVPDGIEASIPPTPPEEDTSIDTSTSDSNSTTPTIDPNTSSDSNSSNNESPIDSLISSITSHFQEFSGVTITSDDDYFYISSFSWPEHGMGVGITSWQEQVPIPQNYTGENKWVIPLNPEIANEPLRTSDHLLKGALAVAVNGVPIFNVFNNRGENAYLIGELDNWGGHFGRGDDYHYHLIPTHLEETVGTDQPLAYALDGYPIYGYTDQTLDQAFGRYDSDGKYRYHAKTTAPYYMPYVMGEITIDPNSTAPEDQIYPQPRQNPIRPSNDFKPLDGASVTGFSQTGTNAFSFEYSVSGVKYYVNYNWNDDCKFTYTYVDENGGTTNLPTYGGIADTSQNVEVYDNVSFCQDVNLGDATYVIIDDNSSVTEEITDSITETTTVGGSATSTNSNFTLSSLAINTNGELLDDYRCERKVNGIEKSIPIAWSNVPEGTGSIAISIHGFPNPNETNSYLTLWGIDTSVTSIAYGEANDGTWFMGPNKDGAFITYSSPCSPSVGSATYYMTIYALSETPSSLPQNDSLTVDYTVMLESFSEVTIIDQVVLEYVSITN